MNHQEIEIRLSEAQLQKIGESMSHKEITAHLRGILDDIYKERQLAFVRAIEGGTSAFICILKKKQGERLVAKIPFKNHDNELDFKKEINALKLADEKGYVKLLGVDEQYRFAILEMLGKPLANYGYSSQKQIEIIINTLKNSWKPFESTPHGLVGACEILDWFQNFIDTSWAVQNQPFSLALKSKINKAILDRRKDMNPQRFVLVHGDAHNMNILKDEVANEHDFKFIDPDGIICEPEYDLGVLMREWIEELFPNCQDRITQRLHTLMKLTGFNKVPIWHWGLMQLCATGLVLNSVNQKTDAEKMFELAEQWTL